MLNKVLRTLTLCSLSFILLSCSDSPDSASKSSVKLERADSFITGEANLRQKLPADVLAYLRVPSIWGFYSAPKGNLFDNALANKAHSDAIKQIQESIHSKVISQVDKDFYEHLSLLLYRISAPLEIAILKPEVPNPSLATVLLHTQLKYGSAEEFNAAIAKMAVNSGGALKVLSPQTDTASGQILATMLSVFYQFDPVSRSVYFYAGMSATEDKFTKLLSGLSIQKTHPMFAIENEIDQSKRGLFLWANGEQLKPILSQVMPPSNVPMLQSLLDTPFIALGWGTVNGKDRIKLMTDLSNWSNVNFLPEAKNELSLYAAGQPEAVAGINLPSMAQIKLIEAEAKKVVSPEEWQQYQDLLTQFESNAGLSLHSLFEAFGSEVLAFSDEAGEFSAIKISDAKLAKQWLDRLVKKFGLIHNVKQLHGTKFNHLKVNFQGFADEDTLSQFDLNPLMQIYIDAASTTHLFWIEEDGYWVFSSIPQLLMDRVRSEDKTVLATWLKQQQKQNVDQSLLYGSVSIPKVPRYLYQFYLSSMLGLADLAEAPFDVYSLPSPKDLQLPEMGTFGMQLDVNKGRLDASITFENNPLELLLAGQGSMATVATVGILAAVALPAYQEYVNKSKYAVIVTNAMPITWSIERYIERHQTMPMSLADLDKTLPEMGIMDMNVDLYSEEGVLAVTVKEGEYFGTVIYFERDDSEMEVKWRCSSEDIDHQHLPASCR